MGYTNGGHKVLDSSCVGHLKEIQLRLQTEVDWTAAELAILLRLRACKLLSLNVGVPPFWPMGIHLTGDDSVLVFIVQLSQMLPARAGGPMYLILSLFGPSVYREDAPGSASGQLITNRGVLTQHHQHQNCLPH